jgi:hypothetical protein
MAKRLLFLLAALALLTACSALSVPRHYVAGGHYPPVELAPVSPG